MNDSTARIDAARARKVAAMLINEPSAGANETPDEILADVKTMDPAGMLERYHAKRDKFQASPFDPEGQYLRFLRGEWTILSGYPGSGKTTAIRQQICSILKSGAKVFTASLEQDPEDYVVQLAGVAAGTTNITADTLGWFLSTYGESLKVWNVTDETDHRVLLATIRDLARKGFRHSFVDSLMCLDIEGDDLAGQKRFALLTRATAIATKCHIYLVAHPRKPMKAGTVPDVHDVAGSSAMSNLAFNVLFIRRGEADSIDSRSNPIQMVVRKQRTMGMVGELNAWYHRDLSQITLSRLTSVPIRYLPDDAYLPEPSQDNLPAALTNFQEDV